MVFVPSSPTTAATVIPPVSRSVILELAIVEADIGLLKVTTTGVATDTAVARFAGDTDTTVGGISSRVVNAKVKGAASAFPAASRDTRRDRDCNRRSVREKCRPE